MNLLKKYKKLIIISVCITILLLFFCLTPFLIIKYGVKYEYNLIDYKISNDGKQATVYIELNNLNSVNLPLSVEIGIYEKEKEIQTSTNKFTLSPKQNKVYEYFIFCTNDYIFSDDIIIKIKKVEIS